MQALLDLGPGSPIPVIRDRLRQAFGSFHSDERMEPLSQLVKSSISARTRDEVSWPAYLRLRRAYPAWSRLAEVSPGEIEALISDVEFAAEKAERLGRAIGRILEKTGALRLDFLADWPIEPALAWLKDLPGVGHKVACAVLNFSTLRRPVMVADTHVWRVSCRLGLCEPGASAEKASKVVTAAAPARWSDEDFYELHWLLKRLGQTLCEHQAPRCGPCPLRGLCPVGKGHIRAVS